MVGKQIEFKVESENNIVSVYKSEFPNTNFWTLVLTIFKNEKKNYSVEINGQCLFVHEQPHITPEGCVIYCQNQRKVFFSTSSKDCFYFRNDKSLYSLFLVPSGTKGNLYPITKNNKPVAIFSSSTSQINGKSNIVLFINDLELSNDIILLFCVNYLSKSNELLNLGIFSVHNTLLYTLFDRNKLTKSHIALLPKDKRPSLLERLAWVAIGLIIVIITAVYSPKTLLIFLSIYILYGLGRLIISRNWRN